MARTFIAPRADATLEAAVRSGERLVERATRPGLARGLDELGDIAIPDPVSARIDKAQLQTLASLYLAADLESAGVIPAVEALAGLSANGTAGLDLGAAETLVAQWWRHRPERLSSGERAAFFARLFGTAAGPIAADAGRNVEFEEHMLELCEALYKLDETPRTEAQGDFAHQAHLRSAARALAQNLGAVCTGVTAFMAGEIVSNLKDAVAILGHAELRRCFGARDIWDVVAGIGRLSRERRSHPDDYVRRGRAGLMVIAWLAEVVDALGGIGPLATMDNPVISAAADWMEATLRLGESGDGAPPSASNAQGATTSSASRRTSSASAWAPVGR